ncbi:MAG TPA: ATP-binding protein [Spongiibacteraceae bacterium]|jgi:two-component system sensor histidine kinase RegB
MALLTAAKANLQRLALVRLLLIGGQLAAIVYAFWWLHAELDYRWLLGVAGIIFVAAVFTFWRLGRGWPVTDVEFFAQLLFDVGSLSALLYASGGATNPFVSYYLVPLSIAATVLPWRYTAALAVICVGAYSALLFFFEPLPLFSPMAEHQHHQSGAINPHIFGMWCNFALSAALITYVVVLMANALREQQRELNLRREQALHSEQLLAIATLAAGTAHELGTPLATMTVLLDEMHSEDQQLRADIQMLQRQVQSCRATLKKLVNTAQTHQQRQLAVQRADEFLRALLERWQIVRPSARYEWQCVAQHAPLLHTDEALQQAIINLLDNGADTHSGPLLLQLDWDDRSVTLHIRDRGPGVPLAIAEQLGRPFVTSKGNGFGLGLFLSHATIERCGGEIRLYNHAEGGTEAVLRLPLARSG